MRDEVRDGKEVTSERDTSMGNSMRETEKKKRRWERCERGNEKRERPGYEGETLVWDRW